MQDKLKADTSWFPDVTATDIDFLDSSFFQTEPGQKRLPSPAEVIARSKDFKSSPRATPVIFEDLNLVVKCGHHVKVEEALCQRMVHKILANRVPVPEVYGWKVEEGFVFIYMELIQGDPLCDRWDHLSDLDRKSICHQLHEIVSSLRQVEQDPTDPFIGTCFLIDRYMRVLLKSIIGSITRRHLLDYVFEDKPRGGPFKSIKEFNDWFSELPQHRLPESLKYQDPYRPFLPDSGTIKLTHGDLHQGNIMISTTSPPRVLAVIDWAHSGWYPEYWEYCKALYTSSCEGDWRNVWIPKFLDTYTTEFNIFAEYIMWMGAI